MSIRRICAWTAATVGAVALVVVPLAAAAADPAITATWGGYALGTWTNDNVTGTFHCDPDSTLPIQTVVLLPAARTFTAEGGSQSVDVSCTDSALNTATRTFGLVKIDKSDPSITSQGPTTQPNAAGWYDSNVVNAFNATDALSGLSTACNAAFPKNVSTTGEGSAVTAASGACSDAAGNSNAGIASSPFKVDKTAPTVTSQGPTTQPNAAGWYDSNVVNAFNATDALSGLSTTCDGAFPKNVAATGEGTAVTVASGPCADVAGNSSPGVNSAAFKIDKTNPAITSQGPTTQPNAAGWYDGNVVTAFNATDALSGLSAACDTAFPKNVTASAEGAAVTVASGTCADVAGNAAPAINSPAFKIDKTNPTIANQGPTPASPNGTNGWYTTNVVNRFAASDALSGLSAACNTAFPKNVTASAEGAAVTVASGACADAAGNSAPAINSAAFKIDKTDPVISVTARKQDGTTYVAGTETPQDVTLRYTCSDAGSGIASCPPDRTYNQLGNYNASGTATDRAGRDTTATFGLVKIIPYASSSTTTTESTGTKDSSPPGPVTKAAVRPGDHSVVLKWVAPAANDLAYVEVRRTIPGKAGAKTVMYKSQAPTLRITGLKNDVTYRFSLVAYDNAGNASRTVVVTATPVAVLLALPKAGTKLAASEPPLLRWAPMKAAAYFNVQLYRNGVKVLTAWPRRAHLQLSSGWTFDSARVKLKPGTYKWYVWPGLGKRAEKRYGAMLGKSTFVVTK